MDPDQELPEEDDSALPEEDVPAPPAQDVPALPEEDVSALQGGAAEVEVTPSVDLDRSTPSPVGAAPGASAGPLFGASDRELSEDADRELIDHPASRFLAREFLIWLWWRSEQDYGRATLDHFGEVDFWIDDRLQFRTPGDQPQTSDLKGGAPATTAEARMALVAGKTLETARLGLRVKEREYSLELRGEGLELAGVKVPAECTDGVEEQLYERMFLLEEATGILDAFFGRFCEQRLGDSWDTGVLPEIRAWVGEVIA